MTAAPAAPARTDCSSALERLARALAGSAEDPPPHELCVVDTEVPARRAEALLALDVGLDASYWAEPNGVEQVGLGSVHGIEASGPERFRTVTRALDRAFADLGASAPRMRLFGGFAFQAGRAASAPWQALGEARFSVPRLSYERHGDSARLALVLRRDELGDPAARARAVALAERALDALFANGVDAPSSAAFSVEARLEQAREREYLALVELARQSIARGELEKVVLARRVELALSRPPPVADVLRRLSAIAPECVRYAFRSAAATFVGATPERLVQKRGRDFSTEAVAGSISSSGEDAQLRLLESAKDRTEQAIVVRELLNVLEPIAESVEHAALPEIHRLRHVVHLRTRIEGRLRQPLHVLDLVERVHPTPAVGGAPKARALSWIAEHEPDERGWYAGPIGWVDANGDGAFVVALRSGLLYGERVALYAGAGIVEGSDPERELAETRWKLEALLGALGVRP